jgi:hypothetical protein
VVRAVSTGGDGYDERGRNDGRVDDGPGVLFGFDGLDLGEVAEGVVRVHVEECVDEGGKELFFASFEDRGDEDRGMDP